MENTLENKAKVFAFYLNQEVFCIQWGASNEICEADKLDKNNYKYLKDAFLKLKPTSSISDQDLTNISFDFPEGTRGIEFEFQPDNYKFHWKAKKGIYIKEGYLTLKDFDYLRSKGYALPAFGLSVSELVNRGWIVLTSPNSPTTD